MAVELKNDYQYRGCWTEYKVGGLQETVWWIKKNMRNNETLIHKASFGGKTIVFVFTDRLPLKQE